MTLNYVDLTLDLYDGRGNPVAFGNAILTPTAVLTDTTDHQIITQAPIWVPFSGATAGTMPPQVRLLATDNGNVTPTGWGWTITPPAASGVAPFSFFLPHSGGASQFLSALTPVAAPAVLAAPAVPGVFVAPSGDLTGATDTTVIQALENLGAKKIYFGAGSFWVTGLTKVSGTYWEGAGIGSTVLNLAAGADADVIQGAGFSSLTMTGVSGWGTSGISDFGISGMTIDGNASGQSGTSYGIRVYGYQWTLRDLDVRNCLTDGIWTEWGALSSNAPITSDGSEATAINVRCTYNGRHGWSHLGPSDCRKVAVLCFLNNQSGLAAGVGYWALLDQISNVCSTASGMNGASASGFTGTFTVQAAAAGGATDLYAPSGTLHVTTSSGTATMTYTGKTAATFTGCTVTSGSGTFQTGNAVATSASKFTSNGLQISESHSWGNTHTWAAIFDGQVSDGNSHWEGGQYGQLLIRSSANKAGGTVYDISSIETGCGIQLGDNGLTGGVPLSASIKANACDLRTRAYGFMNDTATRSSLNWVSASQTSADVQAITKQSGTFATVLTAGSNGVDLSTFTGGSPGTLFVASTQQIPSGPGTLTVATSNGNQTATFTGTNGSNGPVRSAGTQFTGVVAVGVPGGSVMSTGGAVSLQNLGGTGIGGTVDPSSRVRVQVQSSTTALSTAASFIQELGPHVFDVGVAANGWEMRVNGTQQANFNGTSKQFQFPNGTDLRGYSDNFATKTWEIPGSSGAASLTSLVLTGSPLPVSSGGTGAVTAAAALAALGAAPIQAAPAVFRPANPATTVSTSLVMCGIGATCTYTPSGSGLVLVTVSGVWFTAATAVQGDLAGRFGTGTAPVNGAAVTGTRYGTGNADSVIHSGSATSGVPFCFTDLLTLVPGTTYWFDLATSTSNASDAATTTNISMTLVELP